jgi:long-chain acyl-CoA synthetase
MPDQDAIVFGDLTIGYKQLHDAVRRLAAGLKTLGIAKGDRVAVMLPNIPHFIISYYAILELGAVVVPINIMHRREDVAYLLSDSGARCLIAWDGFRDRFLGTVAAVESCESLVVLGEEIPQDSTALTTLMQDTSPLDEGDLVLPHPDDTAVINYTAGVTCESHGSELSHDALCSNAETCRTLFHIEPTDRAAGLLPLFHPAGQTCVMNASLFSGAVLVLFPRFDPPVIGRELCQNRITIMTAVPDMIAALTTVPAPDSSTLSLKYCISYGDKLGEQTIREFESAWHAPVLTAYGLTEAGPLVAAHRFDGYRRSDSVGVPIVGVEVQIRDADGQILKPNHVGEVWVKSPAMMRRYHNRVDETQTRIRDGWLSTGDIGYLDMEHYLYILDRKEDIICKAGFNIFPSELEQLLTEHPSILEAAAVAIPDAVYQSEVKVVVVSKPDAKLTKQDVVEFCKERLPLYKVPKVVEIRSALPKNATGRVLRRFLRPRNL